MSNDIVTRLQTFCECIYHESMGLINKCHAHEIIDEIRGLEADRDRWRALADALTRDLAFRTDEKTASFIVEQIIARVYREESVRGE